MLVFGLFMALLALGGGGVARSHLLFPAAFGWSAATSSTVFGALCGAGLSTAVYAAWRVLGRVSSERDDFAVRTMNAAIVGTGGALLGGALAYALRLAFSPSAIVRIVEGAMLAGGALAGARIGFSTASAVWRATAGSGTETARSRKRGQVSSKILDTSVIIDGRIGDLAATGFVEGEIVIPEFVLAELQNVADSADSLRRRKGRRGLEILRTLMDDDGVSVRILRRDYPSISEVDRKLIRLAREEGAVLVTTDYNLNRVAQVEGVRILNVNQLANAVKPRFVPGEPIDVEVIDRGAEINQGVGYLDDGTMIVVENGRRHIGRTIKATVKSMLQTEAGRMLFVEPANEAPRWER